MVAGARHHPERGQKEEEKANLLTTSTSYRRTRSCELKLWNSPHILYIFQGYILIRHKSSCRPGHDQSQVRVESGSEEDEEKTCKRRNGAMEWRIEARLWRLWQTGGRWERCKMKVSERERRRSTVGWEGSQQSVTKWFCRVLASPPEISWPFSIKLESGKQYL